MATAEIPLQTIQSMMGRFAIDRHGNHTVNLSFVDGHATNMHLKDLWTEPQWHVSYQRPKSSAMPANWIKLP